MTFYILLLSLVFIQCTYAKSTVTIGVASNFSELSTVHFNPFGGYFRDAIDLAIKDNQIFLQKKGIQIELKELDYGTNDLHIIQKVKEAANSDIVTVIGYNYSSNALMAAPLHMKAKLPMLSPSASANRLGSFGKYVHLGSFSNEFMAKTLATVATKVLNYKNILILTAANCAYCVDLSNTFSNEFTSKGGTVVKNISIIQEDQDFQHILKEVKALKFDAVFVPNQELTAARLISTLLEAGIKDKPFLGADGWGNEGSEFFRVLKGKKFTGYSVTHWHPKLNTEKSQKFVKDYLKTYNKLPNDTSVLAYDSMGLLIKAIGNAKKLDREGVEASLSSIKEFSGITGKFHLSSHKAPLKDIVILKTTDTGFAIHKIIHPTKVGQL